MSYFKFIKAELQKHISLLKSIENDSQNSKLENHLSESLRIDSELSYESPEKLKCFIEYLSKEGRNFGWSFPENRIEEDCENSFWNMKNQIKKLIGGMTVNERLYYFGYLGEYENLPINHKSERNNILVKLFIN
jgi:hypothetical protein